MTFLVLLGLGWVGVALAAAVLMGRVIAAGKGDLGWRDTRSVSADERNVERAGDGKPVVLTRKREAA